MMNTFPCLALTALLGTVSPAIAQVNPTPNAQNPQTVAPSLRAHLQLKAGQIDALNQIYDDTLTKRAAWPDARARALQILTPVQRAQLDFIARDARSRIRDDQYSQLLLTPLDQIAAPDTPVSPNDVQRDNSRRDSKKSRSKNRQASGRGSYGVYGGYGYGGPNYGVYGNYGQGNVGVGGSIGRYGPNIGVTIGRVFGGRWFR